MRDTPTFGKNTLSSFTFKCHRAYGVDAFDRVGTVWSGINVTAQYAYNAPSTSGPASTALLTT